jgi:hypothetical protein
MFGFALQMIVFFLWHPSIEVRKSAFEAVRRMHSASAKFLESLLDGFTSWLLLFEDQLALKSRFVYIIFLGRSYLCLSILCMIPYCSDIESSPDAATIIIPNSEELSKALISLAVPAIFYQCKKGAQIILACHNQCLVRGCRADAVWKVRAKYDISCMFASE